MNRFKILILALSSFLTLFAQDDNNPITTIAPFLRIAPDSRGSAMGDAGVATSSDVYSQYWNPAKYAFSEDKFGLGISYVPWLANLVDDIGLIDVVGYYQLDDKQTLSGSLRFFSMGEIIGTDYQGIPTQNIEPTEFGLDIAYSRKFSEYWSGAVAFRYIRSDLSGGSQTDVFPGNAVAADIAAYYRKDDIYVSGYPSVYSFGLNISNMGSKLSYDKGENTLFLPTNMGIGNALQMDVDDYNSITVTLDVNKLLVPTPASVGVGDTPEERDDDLTRRNKDIAEMGSLEGIITSFGDADGGFKEEMQELMFSLGLEYVYDNAFSVRGGYFHEHENKGNRKFFSVGAGFKMNVFALDVSYLVPVDASSPLANTMRFSLSFDVDGLTNMLN